MRDFKKLLQEKRLKVTKGRLEVLEILEHSTVPMNTEEIFAKLQFDTSPSFTSLYRILNQLANVGLLRKNIYQNGITYYESANDSHRHFIICSSCGKIQQVSHCPIENITKKIEQDTGYIVGSHTLEFKGICPDCQKKMAHSAFPQ